LAFLRIGDVEGNSSFVRSCSFNDGYNTALGVYGTNNLLIEGNVIYHGVNELVKLEGEGHQLIDNLISLSLAEVTYKVNAIYSSS